MYIYIYIYTYIMLLVYTYRCVYFVWWIYVQKHKTRMCTVNHRPHAVAAAAVYRYTVYRYADTGGRRARCATAVPLRCRDGAIINSRNKR